MVKLSKPADGKQASLRDRFPALSSLSERPANSNAGKRTYSNNGVKIQAVNQAKSPNRSKSLFTLAQSFFKKVDDADGYTTQPTTHTSNSSFGTRNDRENIRRPSNLSLKQQYNTWNPLASIRGRLDKGFFSVRGRDVPQPQPSTVDAGIDSPLKHRKSLGGLHNAWGTVGKKFTLRGRKRDQGEAAHSAYGMEAHEAIELPDLSPTVYVGEDCKPGDSSSSSGLSGATRVSSSDSRSTALLDRGLPDDPQPITIPKSTNSTKRYSEERTSDTTSCSPKSLRRVRKTSKKVAFASITQLQLMEADKKHHRAKSDESNFSLCPGPGSDQLFKKGWGFPSAALPAESTVSPQRFADYGEKTLAEEQADMDLIEKLLDDGESFTSVDVDIFHERRRSARQARYNMLMDPAKQVENFEIFTQVIENTARMLVNVGHPDIEVISRGSSFSGPVYTWTDANTIIGRDMQKVDSPQVSAAPDSLREEGKRVIHYRATGFPKIELDNQYNQSVVTVTELVETDEGSATTTPERAPESELGLEFNAEKCRGRSLSRTPTKHLAVNNRDKSKSPLKRLQVRLAPITSLKKRMNDASPSSTTATRCPSRASNASSCQLHDEKFCTPAPTNTLTRFLELPKQLVEQIWTYATSQDENELACIDLEWLALEENQTNKSIPRPQFLVSVAAELAAFKRKEAAKSRRAGKASTTAIGEGGAVEFDVASFASRFGLAYLFACDEAKTSTPDHLSKQLEAFQAREAEKFRRGTATSNDDAQSTVDDITVGERSPGETSIYGGLLTPNLALVDTAGTLPSSSNKAKNVEELEIELLAFQAEEEAKFKRVHDRAVEREQEKKSMGWPETLRESPRCCQYWRSCAKDGRCYKVREKELLSGSGGRPWYLQQDIDMKRKQKHWVEGYSGAKRGPTASKEKKDRDCSFTFMAHGKRIRMATYGGSSFFVKTSSTPVTTASVPKAMGEDMPQTPILEGKEKTPASDDEDSLALDNSLAESMDYEAECTDDDNHITLDADFHPQPIFTFPSHPTGYSTAVPGASSTFSVDISPKTFNNYGNIVRCWSPSALLPKGPHIDDVDHAKLHSNIDAFQWSPSTQRSFCTNYPTNPSGPPAPVQRNDSGYWDAEKAAQLGDTEPGFVPPPDVPPRPEPAPRPPTATMMAASKRGGPTSSPPHSTSAYILSRLEDKTMSVKEKDEFVEDMHADYINTLEDISRRNSEALEKVNAELAVTGRKGKATEAQEIFSFVALPTLSFSAEANIKVDKEKCKAAMSQKIASFEPLPASPFPTSAKMKADKGKSKATAVHTVASTLPLPANPFRTSEDLKVDKGKGKAAVQKVVSTLPLPTNPFRTSEDLKMNKGRGKAAAVQKGASTLPLPTDPFPTSEEMRMDEGNGKAAVQKIGSTLPLLTNPFRTSEDLKMNKGRDKAAAKGASTLPLPTNPFPTSEEMRMDKGKGKVPALPPRDAFSKWKGRAQEWPKQPTHIAQEPTTTQYKAKRQAPAPPLRKVTPQMCIQTRNITSQATINGKGPVSPLTRAWLESQELQKCKQQMTEEKVGRLLSAVEMPYPVLEYFDFKPKPGPATPPEPAPSEPIPPGLTSGAGNVPQGRKGRHFYANVTGDGRAVAIPPIRGLRPSQASGSTCGSGVSAAATEVDEEFGEELVDFRVVEGMDSGSGEREKRVPSWLLYG